MTPALRGPGWQSEGARQGYGLRPALGSWEPLVLQAGPSSREAKGHCRSRTLLYRFAPPRDALRRSASLYEAGGPDSYVPFPSRMTAPPCRNAHQSGTRALFTFPGGNRTREEHEKQLFVINSFWSVGWGSPLGTTQTWARRQGGEDSGSLTYCLRASERPSSFSAGLETKQTSYVGVGEPHPL